MRAKISQSVGVALFSLLTPLLGGVGESIKLLPEFIILKYRNDAIGVVNDVKDEFKRGVVETQASNFVTLTKQGDKFKVERRSNENQLEADFSFSFDGKFYYSFMRSHGLLEVASAAIFVEKKLKSTLVLSPFTFASTPWFSETETTQIALELDKSENVKSMAFASSKGPRWYDLSWEFDNAVTGLFPTDITIKRFNSVDFYKKGSVDMVSSRRIKVTSIDVKPFNLPSEFFVTPVSKARSLIDYDVSEHEIPSK